jgi:four helix bundle protein
MQDYHQLDIWQRGMDYAVRIYEFTADLPEDERFNLVLQMRKAATSVPLNTAEGAGCVSGVEFARFLAYAFRSLQEQITCLELCQRLYPRLSERRSAPTLIDEGSQIARMVHVLIQRLNETRSA